MAGSGAANTSTKFHLGPNQVDDIELGHLNDDSKQELAAFREFQRFKQFYSIFNLGGPTLSPGVASGMASGAAVSDGANQPAGGPLGSHYDINTRHINNAMSNLHLPRIAVEPFPLMSNPAPIGLCGFALTTFVLSMYNVGAWLNPSDPQGVVMGLALFYGGLVQMIAGIFEMKAGNGFGALAFMSYGGFWLSFASLFVSSFDFLAGFSEAGVSANALPNALGIYLMSWTFFTFFMFLSSFRTNRVLVALFFFLTLTFLFLAVSEFTQNLRWQQAGGGFGILTSVIAWYGAFAALIKKELYGFELPVGPLILENPESLAAFPYLHK